MFTGLFKMKRFHAAGTRAQVSTAFLLVQQTYSYFERMTVLMRRYLSFRTIRPQPASSLAAVIVSARTMMR